MLSDRKVYIGLKYDTYPFGWALRRLDGMWTHAYLIDALNPKDESTWVVWEMTGWGCCWTRWEDDARGEEWAILEVPKVNSTDYHAVAAVARALEGVPYGYLTLIWGAWQYLKKLFVIGKLWVWPGAQALGIDTLGWEFTLVCSEYTHKAFRIAGIPLLSEEDDLALPDDFWLMFLEGKLNWIDGNVTWPSRQLQRIARAMELRI